MGPNGSGKSTLAGVLAGRDGYEVTEGSVRIRRDLLDAGADERAREGVSSRSVSGRDSRRQQHVFPARRGQRRRRPRGEAELDAGSS